MKKLLTAASLFCIVSLNAQQIDFDKTSQNFGKIVQGDIDTFKFSFINSGTAALIISKAETECYCTTVEFPKEAIAPGGKGIVKIIYNSATSYGYQDRTAAIISNSKKGKSTLNFKVDVKRKEFETSFMKNYRGKLKLSEKEYFFDEKNDVNEILWRDSLTYVYISDTLGNDAILLDHKGEYFKQNIETFFADCDSSQYYSKKASKLLNGELYKDDKGKHPDAFYQGFEYIKKSIEYYNMKCSK